MVGDINFTFCLKGNLGNDYFYKNLKSCQDAPVAPDIIETCLICRTWFMCWDRENEF